MGKSTLQLPHTPDVPLTPYRQLWSKTFSLPSTRSPKPWDNRKEDNEELEAKAIVSNFEKCCNFFGCIAASAIYFYLLFYSNHLWTIDTTVSILLAEYCGWSNEKLRAKSTRKEHLKNVKDHDLSLAEKGDYFATLDSFLNCKLDCIAAIVGYREDPIIFTKALESYLQADACRFVLACIDGNDLEDQGMVDVFQKVCCH